MSASSPHGFAVVRRGYRPEQVDGVVTGLDAERVEAAEQVRRMTALVTELAQESERLRHLAATLPPQTYATLGPRAQQLLATAEAEAAALRAAAEEEAQRLTEEGEAAARAAREEAREEAARLTSGAEADASRTLAAARDLAEELREVARADAESVAGRAAEALEETARRCAALLADQDKQHAADADACTRELDERERATDAHVAAVEQRADRVLAEARRAYGQAEEEARHRQEDAEAQAAEIVAHARVREERTERETQRILRDHEERGEELREHMAHVRSSLASLTGRTPAAPALPAQKAPSDV
jgi:cell division septum initiation protein DivIVA